MMIALAFTAALVAQQPSPDALARAEDLVTHGRYASAIELLDRVDREAGPSAAPRVHVRVETLRGDIAGERGDYPAAYAAYDRALDAARRANLTPLALDLLDRIALARADAGEWTRALEYATRAFEENPAPDDRARARYLYWRGVVLLELNEIDQSDQALREGLTYAKKTTDLYLTGNILRRSCILNWRFRKDRAAALRACDAGLEYARRARAPRLIVNILNNSANIFRTVVPQTAADRVEALRRYQEGVRVARRDGVSGVLPTLLKNIGVIHRQLGQFDEAVRAMTDAVREADAIGLGTASWQGRLELAQLYRDRDPALADRYLADCLEVFERLNDSTALEDYRAGVLAGSLTLGNPYDEYIDLLLARNQPDRAFVVAERSRARMFLETLSTARQQIAAAIPAPLAAEERRLLRKISASQLTLRTGDLDTDGRRQMAASVDEDEKQLERLRLRISSERPELGNARFPHLWSVGELQQRILGPGAAIVTFSLRKTQSTAWVIRTNGVDAVTLPPRDRVDAAVRPLLAALQNPNSDARAAARPLEAIMTPVIAALGPETRRVEVIPDGILSYVPFEALTAADGALLLERYAISYAPSASSYAFLRTNQAVSGDQVIALGNPVLQSATRGDTRGAPIERIGFLPPLPSTADELRAIARVFPGASQTLERERATETALEGSELARAGILHFATHAVVDEDHPQRSGLALTPAGASDGILQMREVYGLKLHAALVTLSACQTALGKRVTGEGLIGLSRAFFYAGANAVMASLWNVDDASTARLMGDFYGAIHDGAAIDEAARQAKRSFISRDPRFRHPYYWAAFIVSGNAAAPVRIASTPRWRRALPFEAAALALFAAGYGAWRGYSRRVAITRRRTHAETL